MNRPQNQTKKYLAMNTLYRWINEHEEYRESAVPWPGTALFSYQYEMKKLNDVAKQLLRLAYFAGKRLTGIISLQPVSADVP